MLLDSSRLVQQDRVRSAFYDDSGRFSAGSIAFDSALVMRDIRHAWHPVGTLRAD